jgi:hypothetical protein
MTGAKNSAKAPYVNEHTERQMNTLPQPVAYDLATAVAVSGIGRTRLYAYIKAKQLKARKAGRRTVILASDLQAFLDSLPVIEAA